MTTMSLLLLWSLAPLIAVFVAARARMGDSEMAAVPFIDGATFTAEHIDLNQFLPTVAAALLPMARASGTRIGLAVSHGRTVNAHRATLAAVLRRTIETAILAAPGGYVLVSVFVSSGEINISVADDGPNPDRLAREAAIHIPPQAIAPHIGSLTVETLSGLGSTVTLRMPAPNPPAAERTPAGAQPSEVAFATQSA